jgi:branched-chain amino acid transport system permease protein
MTDFLQQIFNGLLLGGVYALFAVGLTLSLGVLRVMNAAHGATLALSAILAIEAAQRVSLSFPLFVLVAAAAGGGIGIVLELFAFRPLRFAAAGQVGGNVELPSFVASFAILFILQAIALHITGAQLVNVPLDVFQDKLIFVGDYYFRKVLIVTFVFAVAVLGILWLIIARTQFGRAVRAIAMDEEAAGMLGVNANRLKLITISASSALAGVAGALLAITFGAVDYQTGSAQLLRGFAVVILGGIGSVTGSLVGGLLLGLAEGLTIYFWGSNWQPAAAFVLLIGFLLIRPQGIFGKPQVERA